MRILLINPFGSNWVEGMEDKTETAIRMAPMGILSIAAYLEQQGVETAIHDCRGPVTLVGTADVMSRVAEFKPDMVGFTAVTSSFLNAYRQAEAIKQASPAYQDHRRRRARVRAARKDPRTVPGH